MNAPHETFPIMAKSLSRLSPLQLRMKIISAETPNLPSNEFNSRVEALKPLSKRELVDRLLRCCGA